VLCLDEPETLVVARNGSPVCIGVGDGEYVVASDPSAIIEHTRRLIFLDDHEIAALRADDLRTFTIENVPTVKQVEEVKWDVGMLSTGGYETFMLKEIHEQPETIHNAFRGRLDVQGATARLGGLLALGRELVQLRKIVITACGTALHAGMVAEYLLEDVARLPVEIEFASEFRYRNPVLEFGTAVIVISQSGETADTIAALREAKRRGVLVLAVSNVIGSSIARESDAGVYIHAGPEIGVASTKAFTSQLTVLYLISLLLGRARHIGAPEGLHMIRELEAIPDKVRSILAREDEVKEIARAFEDVHSCLYLGRGYGFPVALEGALKLKEISYIHAEGYPAAEMKHGPIALITPHVPSVFIATKSDVYEKVRGNIEEVKARGGPVIAIATEGDEEIGDRADHVFWIPECPDALMPLLAVVPLQLLAYHVARNRGLDVDKPRNLAKSVTVE
ncbi:MAG: glutamine--fructose-6-phosphate transaminase (isomerizing), partial [Planctomycetes bacterium]|nr:glutamine--fructose-6-phosphate transaminase (isomerizing) [Planctomycetota bacterium]